MPENPVMFNTVVTSDLGEIIAKEYGEKLKNITGFKYIGDKIEGYKISKEKTSSSVMKKVMVIWLRKLFETKMQTNHV